MIQRVNLNISHPITDRLGSGHEIELITNIITYYIKIITLNPNSNPNPKGNTKPK